MSATIETVNSVTKKIVIQIPKERVARELDTAYRNLQNEVRMKGFRPGHVPRTLLESRFKTQVEGEVVTKLVSETLEHTINEQGLSIVSQPMVEPGRLSPKLGFEYTATVEVKPEFKAKDYIGLELSQVKYQLDESAVDKQLEQIREKKSNLVVIEEDRPLEDGDVARMEYSTKIEGKMSEYGKDRSLHLQIRPDAFVPGFAPAVIGIRKGEVRDFELDIPQDYHQKALAGKHIEFSVKLHDIKRKELPALDDEFAKDLEFDSLDALKEKIRSDLREHLDDASELKVRKSAADILIERNSFELPQGLVNQQIDLLAQEQYQQTGRQIPKGNKLKLTNEQRELLSKEASFRLRTSLILESIAKQENLEVTEEDINTRFEEIAKETNKRVEAIRGLYMKNNAIEDLKEKLLEEKALEFVVEKANVEISELPFSAHEEEHHH